MGETMDVSEIRCLRYCGDRYHPLTSKDIRVRWIATGNSGPWIWSFQRRLVPPAYQGRSPLFPPLPPSTLRAPVRPGRIVFWSCFLQSQLSFFFSNRVSKRLYRFCYLLQATLFVRYLVGCLLFGVNRGQVITELIVLQELLFLHRISKQEMFALMLLSIAVWNRFIRESFMRRCFVVFKLEYIRTKCT